jgi:predicted protein tyrosine phosphatase
MPEFTICGKSEVKKTTKRWGATHIISTLDQGDRLFRPPRVPVENHLQLWFEDEEDAAKWGAPTLDHAHAILTWSEKLPPDARCLIHCFAGACRSTAIGISLWLQHNGAHRVPEAAEWLKQIRPQACPNLLLAAHFDQLLGLQGELVRMCDTIGADSINRWWKLNHPN